MKVKTYVRAGECTGSWEYGVVEKSSGGGYYGQIRSDAGSQHYFNNGYTKFCPYRQGVVVGQNVMFQTYQPPNERAGKVSCISPA